MISKIWGRSGETSVSTDLARLRNLPTGSLRMGRFALWWVRKTFFTREKPENPAVFVEMTAEEITELLGQQYFEPGWEMSYSYQNEKLNLRRVEYVPDHPTGIRWWQVHIRGFHHSAGEEFETDTFELAAHFEAEPIEYPRLHVEEVGLEIERGARTLMGILDAHGIEYEFMYPDHTPVSLDDLDTTFEPAANDEDSVVAP
jgi:hypothetical protein